MLSTATTAPLKTSAHLMIQTCSNWAGKVALAVHLVSKAAKLKVDRLVNIARTDFKPAFYRVVPADTGFNLV